MSTITILDGGMGQELIARSKNPATPYWSTSILSEEPHLVRDVHGEFFAAGAQIATTASYSIHHDRLGGSGLEDQFASLHETSCRIACEARDAHGSGQVAGAIGPLGWSYRPEMAHEHAKAAALFAEVAALQAPLVDFHIIETVALVAQAEAALEGAMTSDKPVWIAFSVRDDDGTKLRSDEPLTDILPVLAKHKPSAVLLNCSTPEAVSQGLPLLADAGIPFGAYANGFVKITEDYAKGGKTVDELSARKDLTPAAYAEFARSWADMGATIIGGCCEVSPKHIAAVAEQLREAG